MHILSSLTTAYSLTSSSVDDMGSLNDVYSVASSLATTLSTIPMHGTHIDIYLANNYINSLSLEQLEEFELKLKEQEEEFCILPEQNEKPKVYRKNKSVKK